MNTKQKRLDAANHIIVTIASCGRRFFWNRYNERFARFEVDHRGRVWFIDAYSGKRIYTHYSGRWRGFTNGGTLQTLVCHLRDYIVHGKRLRSGIFGPWPEHFCNGDLWGYGDDMRQVRGIAKELGIVAGEERREPKPHPHAMCDGLTD